MNKFEYLSSDPECCFGGAFEVIDGGDADGGWKDWLRAG